MSSPHNLIYALLVGINDYAPSVGKLRGCLDDVSHFQDHLTDTLDPRKINQEVLKDSDSTRGNIIKLFRSYLDRQSCGIRHGLFQKRIWSSREGRPAKKRRQRSPGDNGVDNARPLSDLDSVSPAVDMAGVTGAQNIAHGALEK